MKRIFSILAVIFAIGFANNTQASHLIGGEITWVCLKSGANAGKFVFTLKVYRECSAGSAGLSTGAQNLKVWNNPSLSSITCNYVSLTDLSPSCYDSNKEYYCGMARPGGYTGGAVEEGVYVSNPITISGVPPAGGWIFSWSSCCRPNNIVNTSSGGFALRAIMYPFNGQNTNPCYDSSPQFIEKPATILCIGYPFSYNHMTEDEELDSLVYAWATGYQSTGATWPPSPIVYTAGYSANSPLPGKTHNAKNVPATVNPNSGVISFESYTAGSHATVVEVTAWKCQQKVAQIYRDIPVVLANCPVLPFNNKPNNPPVVKIDGDTVKVTGYTDTVQVGDKYCFKIESLDPEFNDNPPTKGQINTLIPVSSQFGNNFTDTANGCLRPPCATITHPTTGGAPVLSGLFGIKANFCWTPTCAHLPKAQGCVSLSSTYNFVLKVVDDWCPVPGINFLTVSITVKAPPKIPAPSIRCASVDPTGQVILSWDTVKDTLNSFYDYEIYYSTTPGGPYTLIDSVMNNATGSYTDANAARNVYTAGPGYYYMLTRSSCHASAYSNTTDTIQPIDLNVTVAGGGGTAQLNWNYLHNPALPTSNGYYYIYREAPLGVWTLVDSTKSNSWSEPVTVCSDTISYRVEMNDNLPCTSVSTLDGGWFGANTPPPAPPIDSVTVDNGLNKTVVTWTHNATSSIVKYAVYDCAGGVLTFLDTVYVPNNSYTDLLSTPNSKVHHYTIIPFDSCGIKGDTALCNNSIWLRFDSTDHCTGTNYMWWNPYNVWPTGVDRYEIWASENGGAYAQVGNLTGANLDTLFSHNPLNDGSTYCYKVVAFDAAGRSSTSNELCVTVNNLLDSTIIPPPSLRCISVGANENDVILEWLAPNDPTNNFNEYEIWHATSYGGPYSLLYTEPNYATLTYTHSGALLSSPTNYYYIISKSGCYGTDPSRYTSDTLTPMIVTVAQNNGWSGTITWNPIKKPNTATSVGTYRVFREFPKGSGTITQLGTTTYGNEQWLDTINICNDSAKYYVEIDDLSGCTSISSSATGYYLDTIPPSLMSLDSASVGQSGLAHMGWQAHSSGDVAGYYIVKLNSNQSNSIIDTVWGRNNTWYQYPSSNAGSQPESYAITAFDSCGNVITYNYNFHTTIFATADLDVCLPGIKIEWTAYDGWGALPITYEIWVREQGGPWKMVGSTSNLSYVHSPINNGMTYDIYIRARANGAPVSSTSNWIQLDATLFAPPLWHYLQYATVNDTNEVKITAYVDTTAEISKYRLMKAVKRGGNYAKVGIETPNGSEFITFYDTDVLTSEKDYFYKIEAINPCDVVVAETNFGRTILLQVEPDVEASTNTLTFNRYEDWAGDVKVYHIYRSIDGFDSPELIASIAPQSGDSMTYLDELAPELEGSGQFCYQIIAEENDPSFKGPQDTLVASFSTSNVACVFHEPIVYIPNAYIPGSRYSDSFKPSLRFIEVDSYQFSIFDRWGEVIFNTNDVLQGWDGTYQGKKVKTDVYVYLVKFKTSKGKEVEKRGTVTILK